MRLCVTMREFFGKIFLPPKLGKFIDWMSFLPSNLMKEVSPNTESLSANI